MKRVDQILRYLAGELAPEERKVLEQELREDQELKKEFDDLSAAYRMTARVLRERDEDAFRARLEEVRQRAAGTNLREKSLGTHRPFPWRRGLWPLATALTVAALLFLLLPAGRNPYARFYKPGDDPVILAMQGTTRGAAGIAPELYQQGDMAALLLSSREALTRDSCLMEARIYLVLAAMELDREEEVLAMDIPEQCTVAYPLGQSLSWYLSLARLKSGDRDAAAADLKSLAVTAGPYRRDAHKLLKLLTK